MAIKRSFKGYRPVSKGGGGPQGGFLGSMQPLTQGPIKQSTARGWRPDPFYRSGAGGGFDAVAVGPPIPSSDPDTLELAGLPAVVNRADPTSLATSLNGLSGFTLVQRVAVDRVTSGNTHFEYNSGADYGFRVTILTNGRLVVQIVNPSTFDFRDGFIGTDVAIGEDYVQALRFDAGTLTLFLNGVELAWDGHVGSAFPTTIPGGSGYDVDLPRIDGSISEQWIYDTALSDADIAGIGGPTPDLNAAWNASPLSWLRFGENDATSPLEDLGPAGGEWTVVLGTIS